MRTTIVVLAATLAMMLPVMAQGFGRDAGSEQGWNVVESQPACGSKVWIDASTVFASMPERPPPVFAVMKGVELNDVEPEGCQNDCKKHKILSAWVGYAVALEDTPSVLASVVPSRRARCCTAVVKKDEESTSSHKSKVVRFQLTAT